MAIIFITQNDDFLKVRLQEVSETKKSERGVVEKKLSDKRRVY